MTGTLQNRIRPITFRVVSKVQFFFFEIGEQFQRRTVLTETSLPLCMRRTRNKQTGTLDREVRHAL
jgi:hypothetical protein